MHGAELILGLLIAVAALVTLARRLEIAYPIFLVIGGLGLGLMPGVPRIHVDPDLIFLIVLPPLLYIAAFYTPIQNLRANLGTISSLAVGLVIVSACAVAVVAHALVPGISWSAAFALGAIVAPPDAIAATAVTRRLAVSRQIVTILEGESLLNDATALTIYSIALAVAAGAVFSPTGTVLTFAGAILGGGAIGVAVGWIVAHIRARIEDTPVEMTISLLTPYAAFLPADRLDASGVIATVAAGLYLGHRGSHIMGADARLTGRAVWETITFLLNGFVFIVMGLEVPLLLRTLTLEQAIQLVGIGVAVTVLLVLVRALWMLVTVFLPQRIQGQRNALACSLVLSWAGMRGVVSLAAVLALPLTAVGRTAVPGSRGPGDRDAHRHRAHAGRAGADAALVHPGAPSGYGPGLREEEARARQRLLEAATRRLDELDPVWPGHRPLLDQLRGDVPPPLRARRAPAGCRRGRRGRPRADRAPGDPAHGHRRGTGGAAAPSRRGRGQRRGAARPRARARPRRAPHGCLRSSDTVVTEGGSRMAIPPGDVVKQQVAAHWDRRAAHFDEDFGHSIRTPGERAAWDRILGLVVPGRPALDALDVGSGTGFLSFELAARGHRVTGVDFAPSMIAQARHKAAERGVVVRFEEADAEQLPFAPASFDLVISRHLLWTLPHPEAAIDEWIRVLRPGGRLVVVDGQFDTGPHDAPGRQRPGQRGVCRHRQPAALPRRPSPRRDRSPAASSRPDRRGQRSPARSRGRAGTTDGRRRAGASEPSSLCRLGRRHPGATVTSSRNA